VKTNIYIDGFNLYYRAVKGTPYRWLNLHELCRRLLKPDDHINRIRYFTALITARPDDPQGPQRQQVYIRALETIPCLSVHHGSFLTNTRRMRLANPSPGGPNTAEVIHTEEKGSDVNLATYLLMDAFDQDFELAVVLSGDSDLAYPIEVVHRRFRLPVIVWDPGRLPGQKLRQVASFHKQIRPSALRDSQFPPVLYDVQGRPITKPMGW